MPVVTNQSSNVSIFPVSLSNSKASVTTDSTVAHIIEFRCKRKKTFPVMTTTATRRELGFKRASLRQAVPLTRELVLRAISSGWGEWPEKIKASANVMSAP